MRAGGRASSQLEPRKRKRKSQRPLDCSGDGRSFRREEMEKEESRQDGEGHGVGFQVFYVQVIYKVEDGKRARHKTGNGWMDKSPVFSFSSFSLCCLLRSPILNGIFCCWRLVKPPVCWCVVRDREKHR